MEDRKVYNIHEVFVSPEKAAAIAAMHHIDMQKYSMTDIKLTLDLMGMDNTALIAYYGKIYEESKDE